MKGSRLIPIALLVAIVTLLVTCTPKPAPAAAPATPQVSAEDAAWARVVEAARKEGKVSIYSISYTGDTGTAMTRAFKEKYGISVDVITGSGSVFIPRIKNEERMGQGVGDVLESSAVFVASVKKDGLSLAAGPLPILRDKAIWRLQPQVDAEGMLFYSSPLLLPPWVNSKLVPPGQEPKSLKELLDPKWKGKIVESDPATIPMLNIYYWDYTSRGLLTEDYFRQLARQDVRFVAGGIREAAEKVARGEAHMQIGNITGSYLPFLREGAPVRPIDVEEGVVARGLGITIVKSAPHPNAARVFLNWLLSAEGQTVQGKAMQVGTLRKDTEDYTHPGARLSPKKLIVEEPKDADEVDRVMREGIVAKMFGRK